MSAESHSLTEKPAWFAELQPSRIHQILNASLTVAALLAIAITPLLLFLKIVVSIVIVLFAVHRSRVIAAARQLVRLNTDDCTDECDTGKQSGSRSCISRWEIHVDEAQHLTGTLIQAGYRSAGLLIVVLQSDDSHWHRIPVWIDSVTTEQFSYLNCQIAFNAQAPEPRSVRALLQSLI